VKRLISLLLLVSFAVPGLAIEEIADTRELNHHEVATERLRRALERRTDALMQLDPKVVRAHLEALPENTRARTYQRMLQPLAEALRQK